MVGLAASFRGWSLGSVSRALLAAAALAALAPSAAAGLPDGRIYEQVSPASKNGNIVREESIGLASEDGDAVAFVGTGAMGQAQGGLTEVFVSRRSAQGWTTSATRPRQPGEVNIFGGRPLTLIPSAGFTKFVFSTFGPYVAAEPFGEDSSSNIFLSEGEAVEPAWLARPTATDPIPAPGNNTKIRDYLVAGGAPELSTVYFTYSGTLLPEDAARTPNVGDGMGDQETDPWGFYEWTPAGLSEAGTLPEGTLDAFGAVPAASAGDSNFQREQASEFDLPESLDNEISADGSRAFFVSPDPVASSVTDGEACEAQPPCTSAPPELYARVGSGGGAKTSILISRSEVPGHQGEPAPQGPAKLENTPIVDGVHAGATYVYASADGSQAFFASTDQLTSAAPVGGALKMYDADLTTGTLTYLPGVTGSIAAVAPDGSDLMFENTATTPAELDLWRSGPGGGSVSTIAQLPEAPNVGEPFYGATDISGARASADGSVFVFRTNSPLSGFNDEGGFAQVYRYSVTANEVTCVSCPPKGVAPVGNADVSHDDEGEEPITTQDTRVLSEDGSRVFFDTPNALVAQDVNGLRDVYEWEDGHVYLISSGTGKEASYVLDSSASGDDVFFTTSAGLAPGDVDEARDVYDARIPRAGDEPPPAAVPCEGDGCQGPASLPAPLSPPGSATLNGEGQLPVPPASPKPKPKPKAETRAQKLAQALRSCDKQRRDKRAACVKRARARYGAKPKRAAGRHR